MKLYFLKQDALEVLRVSIGNNLGKYKESNNDWIYEYFEENPFIEFKSQSPDFELKVTRGGVSELEVENSIIIHRSLKNILTPSQASDERFWAGLTHGVFWEYMHNRWEMDVKETSKESIETRYFLKGSNKHALRANTISRLWWVASMFFDENRDDAYELLNAFSHDFVTKVHTFLSLRISSSKIVNQSFAKAIIYLEELEESTQCRTMFFRALLRYINILGGVTILDCYDEKTLTDLLVDEGVRVIDEYYLGDKYSKNSLLVNAGRSIETGHLSQK